MTKKERSDLHSRKATATEVKVNLGRGKEDRVIVSFSLTMGEVMALRNMLHYPKSDIQDDVCAYFRHALERMGFICVPPDYVREDNQNKE